MRIPRIYAGSGVKDGNRMLLPEGASQHLARALRMQVGDALIVFDGSGMDNPATIVQIGKKQVEVELEDAVRTDRESPLAIELGIAVSRGDRMDWVIQKATELGVARISPLFSERTEVKLAAPRAEKKLGHWRQVAISACEQCGRSTLPEIAPLQQIQDWLPTTSADRKFVLHHRAAQNLLGDPEAPGSVVLLIGPEGGLSDTEIDCAEAQGFKSLRLGPRVLRTETAPLAAIAILQSVWGDMTPGG